MTLPFWGEMAHGASLPRLASLPELHFSRNNVISRQHSSVFTPSGLNSSTVRTALLQLFLLKTLMVSCGLSDLRTETRLPEPKERKLRNWGWVEWLRRACGGHSGAWGRGAVPELRQLHDSLTCLRGVPCLAVFSVGDKGQWVKGILLGP